MNLDPLPDGADAPSFYSARGSFLLSLGDTAAASAHHRAAAAALSAEMTAVAGDPDRSRWHLLRFQVATQYFKAGDYRRARELADGVFAELLPGNVRQVFDQFKKDAAERARPGYADGIRDAVVACYPNGTWKRALELLAAHPHVIAPSGMAYMRGVCLENLGKYRPAAMWFGRAFADPQLLPGVLGAATVPDRLISDGRWDAAEAYARALTEFVPHPFVVAAASFVFYRCAHRPDLALESRRVYVRQQIEFLGRISGSEFDLPNGPPSHGAFPGFLAVTLTAAAETMFRAGQTGPGEQLLAEATRLDAEVGATLGPELRRMAAESPPEQEADNPRIEKWLTDRLKKQFRNPIERDPRQWNNILSRDFNRPQPPTSLAVHLRF